MPEEIEKPHFNALIDLINMFEPQTMNYEGLHVYHIRYALLGENCGITYLDTLEKIKTFYQKDINKQIFEIWKQTHASYLAKVKEKGMSPSNLSNHLKTLKIKGYIEIHGKRPDNVCVKSGEQYYHYLQKKYWENIIEKLDHTKIIDPLNIIEQKKVLYNHPSKWLFSGIPLDIVNNYSSDEKKEFIKKIINIQKNLSEIVVIGKKKIKVNEIYFLSQIPISH